MCNSSKNLLVVVFATVIGAACAPSSDDPTLYLTGTEELAATVNGVPTCTHPKKVLICHIPPGNPANAHSICVGKPAEEAHVSHHGDGVGACALLPDGGVAGSGNPGGGTLPDGGAIEGSGGPGNGGNGGNGGQGGGTRPDGGTKPGDDDTSDGGEDETEVASDGGQIG